MKYKTIVALLAMSMSAITHAQIYKIDNSKNDVRQNIRSAVEKEVEGAPLTLTDIMSNNIKKTSKAKKATPQKQLRLNKLREVAFEYGANVGRAEQAKLYEKKVDAMAAQLDRDYDFSRLLIHQNPAILPPIVSEGFDNFKSIDSKTMQVSAHMMKIEVPAQIVSTVPTWRDYLKTAYTVNRHPTEGFQPQDKLEREVWDEAVKAGYEQGKKTADINWLNAYGELKRDYAGMLNYKIALANGLISPSIIEISDLGNVVDEDGNVSRQNEMMIKIIQDAKFSKEKMDANTKRNPKPARAKLPNGMYLN